MHTAARAADLHVPSRGEELANAWTHGAGLILAVAALVVMVVVAALRGSAAAVVGASLFGTTLILAYGTSTLYHALHPGRAKRLLRLLDHSAIYLLIAGTYTPFCLVTLQGAWGWSIFGVVWGIALVGITLKSTAGLGWERASLVLYLLMGWMVVVAIGPLVRALPGPGLAWLAAGGLCYTGGTVFYALDRRRWFHAWWHLCVLMGSACHVAAIAGWVLPR